MLSVMRFARRDTVLNADLERRHSETKNVKGRNRNKDRNKSGVELPHSKMKARFLTRVPKVDDNQFSSEVARVPIQFTSGCIVASIQIELAEEVLERFQFDLLEKIQQLHPHGVILDVTAVEVMDSYDFLALRKTLTMAELMGPKTMLVGLQPGVVSALMDLEVDCEGVRGAFTLEEALDALQQKEPLSQSVSNPEDKSDSFPEIPRNPSNG